jgi:hypothetical protein
MVDLVAFAQQPDKKATSSDTVKKVVPPLKKDTLPETGIAVSPSTMRFNVKPGTLQTKTIKITNDTKRAYTFQLSFQDFGPGGDGESDQAISKYSRFALSKYTVISPTVIEVPARSAKTISVTVDIPAGDSMAISMWTNLDIDQILDREQLEVPNLSKNAVGMGVKNTFGFGVHIYQNPPNVSISSVEITAMKFIKQTENKPSKIIMQANNTGTGIGYCLYYIELTNLVNGKQTKLKVKQFAIFPGYKKEFSFDLPNDIDKGPYSAMAVLDFGNKDELQTAEIEFSIE